MYQIFKRAAFLLSPETAHELTMDAFSALSHLHLTGLIPKIQAQKQVNVFGIDFPNAVGLAAGLDKNGDAIDALGAMGFGFLEVGTVTPRPQPGNPVPRLFRLPEKGAIINRMGFNNKGVDYLVERVRKSRYEGIIGVNIGKNKDTPETEAVKDYLYCLERAYEVADYITVNISSPNTPGLRNLQFGDSLNELIQALTTRQQQLDALYSHKPILIKIAPDLSDQEVQQLVQIFNALKVEGVIATNTTVSRQTVEGFRHADEMGGLSGVPVFEQSNRILKRLREQLDESIPIIGVGGIASEYDAEEKMKMGADLVQVYTGLIYHGPSLIRHMVERLSKL